MFHVVKNSRSYMGVGYSGPTLKRTVFAKMHRAEFAELDDALECARQLYENNPVGFDVYSTQTQRRVYSTNEFDIRESETCTPTPYEKILTP